MAAVMRDVFSSHVQRMGYDDETGEMLVEWDNGKTSAYAGVPKEMADQGMKQASIGSWLHAEVKGKYNHRYV